MTRLPRVRLTTGTDITLYTYAKRPGLGIPSRNFSSPGIQKNATSVSVILTPPFFDRAVRSLRPSRIHCTFCTTHFHRFPSVPSLVRNRWVSGDVLFLIFDFYDFENSIVRSSFVRWIGNFVFVQYNTRTAKIERAVRYCNIIFGKHTFFPPFFATFFVFTFWINIGVYRQKSMFYTSLQ